MWTLNGPRQRTVAYNSGSLGRLEESRDHKGSCDHGVAPDDREDKNGAKRVLDEEVEAESNGKHLKAESGDDEEKEIEQVLEGGCTRRGVRSCATDNGGTINQLTAPCVLYRDNPVDIHSQSHHLLDLTQLELLLIHQASQHDREQQLFKHDDNKYREYTTDHTALAAKNLDLLDTGTQKCSGR